MRKITLSSLEKSTNIFLKMDPLTLQRLSEIAGKTIEINISDWNSVFYIFVKKDSLEFNEKTLKTPDATISGKLVSLFNTAKSKGETTALFNNQVTIEGDLELGQKIQHLLHQIDIDWEEQLSKVFGDFMAHKIGLGAKKILNFSKKASHSFQTNMKEYLQNESSHLPTKVEVEKFITEVQTLQLDVERIEARFNRILGGKSQP